MYAVLRNKKRFEGELSYRYLTHLPNDLVALRSFTLESGQEELERLARRRKERPHDVGTDLMSESRRGSADSIRSPTSSHQRAPQLSDVPEEEGTFAIGDDEDEETDDEQPTPAASTPTEQPSRASSVSSSIDDAVPTQLRGMSEKARGKMPGKRSILPTTIFLLTRPAGMPTFSRQNSTTSLNSYPAPYSSTGAFEPTSAWIESWLHELPLHTILTLIGHLSPLLPRPSLSEVGDTPSPNVLRTLQSAQVRGIEPSPIRIQYFEWSPLSLGWYESLLWSFVFTSEMQVQKGTVGVWNGTGIKLFRVESVAAQGPTLSSPRGAVDAVGSNIVSRIGSINLRGVGGGNNGEQQQQAQQQQGGGGGGQAQDGRASTGTGSGMGPGVRSAVV